MLSSLVPKGRSHHDQIIHFEAPVVVESMTSHLEGEVKLLKCFHVKSIPKSFLTNFDRTFFEVPVVVGTNLT